MGKEPISPLYIRYTGLVDFDALYAAVIDWCKNYGYTWHETTYKHKIPSPKGAEQRLFWKIEKEVTDYIKHEFKMEARVWDLNEIIIEKGGKKKSLSSGKFQIIITGNLRWDWQDRWGKNKFTQKLGKIYDSVIMKKDISSLYWDTMYYRVWNLHALIKKFFDMQAKWHTYKTYLREN
tara:strand:+ start:189 stop:722 length:534 start_codon:yes stop_codon:yes gene_type:complete